MYSLEKEAERASHEFGLQIAGGLNIEDFNLVGYETFSCPVKSGIFHLILLWEGFNYISTAGVICVSWHEDFARYHFHG